MWWYSEVLPLGGDLVMSAELSLMELLLLSHPVVSNSLQPRGLQHIRALCLSPSPEVCPSSCPLHQWWHPAISSSDALFSSASIFPRAGLKLLKKKTKIMAFGPVTSWQIEGGNVEVVTDFLFLVFSSKITVNGDCSHEIRWLLLGRKAMTNLDSVSKSRHCSANRGPYSQSYSLPSGHVWL